MDLIKPSIYLIPTPIGNLEDITFRAIRYLKNVDLIAAEDTRTSSFLLKHFEIKTQMTSMHKFNEHQQVEKLLDKIENESLALGLISDAGTPGISDPGFLLVRQALKRHLHVETLPGPVAFIPALVNSGLPCDKFTFEGFLPQKKGRMTAWKSIVEEKRTMIFYESPYRIVKFLEEAILYLGDQRQVSVSREISKKFEETVRGTTQEVLTFFKSKEPKGEFVVVVAGKEDV